MAENKSVPILDLTALAGRTRMRLRVKTGAKRAEVLGAHAGALKLAVTASPERGKANRAVLKLLARTLDVPLTEIELIAGVSTTDKTVLVPLTPDEARKRLALAASES